MLDYAIGQGYSALDAQAWRDKLDGYAVADGLGVSVDTGLTVSVASGTATVGETSGVVDTVSLGSSTTVTLDSADSTNPRKDTVYIDTTGTVQVETGTAEAADPSGSVRFDTFQPEPPLPSTDGTVLAEVWVAAGASSLSSSDIRDRRVPADSVGDRAVYQDVHTGSLDTDKVGYTNVPSGSSDRLNDANSTSSKISEENVQYTDGVGTSATTIWERVNSGVGGGWVVVYIQETTSNYGPELVLCSSGGVATAVGDAIRGSPTGRTYSINGGSLQLSMDASTTVNVAARGVGFGTTNP